MANIFPFFDALFNKKGFLFCLLNLQSGNRFGVVTYMLTYIKQ